MLEHITYYGIKRIAPEYAARFMPGDEIVIEEKIDGANASFQYDEQGDILVAFSRHQPLDADNAWISESTQTSCRYTTSRRCSTRKQVQTLFYNPLYPQNDSV